MAACRHLDLPSHRVSLKGAVGRCLVLGCPCPAPRGGGNTFEKHTALPRGRMSQHLLLDGGEAGHDKGCSIHATRAPPGPHVGKSETHPWIFLLKLSVKTVPSGSVTELVGLRFQPPQQSVSRQHSPKGGLCPHCLCTPPSTKRTWNRYPREGWPPWSRPRTVKDTCCLGFS